MKTPLPNSPPYAPADASPPARKRLFIGLLSCTAILLSLILLIGWVIPYVGFANIHPAAPYLSGFLLFGLISFIAWASFGLIVQIMFNRPFVGGQRIHGLIIKLFLPLMKLLGRGFGIAPQEVSRSFIKINNQLAAQHQGKVRPEQLLILVPHCLQQSECPVRLTSTVDLCTRCGKCPVSGLIQLRDNYSVILAVATGGSIARRIVVNANPKLIIAVACERDLTSGIQDTHPLPVFGILNQRPHGPCVNTLVDLGVVEEALRYFLVNPKS